MDLFMPEEVCEEVTYAAALSVAPDTPNTHAVGESFEVDMTVEMTGVKVKAVASDVRVSEDNIVCKMSHSSMAVYDSGVLQHVREQIEDVHNMSAASEMTTADSCDTEGEKTDDFSEWIQSQPEQGPQPTWSESDQVTDVERTEMTEEQKDVSESDREEQKDVSRPDRINTGTLFSDLEVKEDTTELITENFEHNETISNGCSDLEEKNGIYEQEKEIRVCQSQSLSTENMADESDQIKALESKRQEKKIVFEESKDNDLPQQEEVIEENKVEEELWAFEDRNDTLFTDSEIMVGVQGERCTDTEQYHMPEKSFEEDVVSVTHNNVSMNLAEDSLPTHQQQDQASLSEEHPELNEDDFNESEEVEERRDYSESEEKELDDSPNVSMSWKTDPGELDSYALDNTLADTRPLIRYKSDDTDVNTQASHMGISDSSDSEDDREAGAGPRSVLKSKRFDTMEDLSEEPEVEVIGKVGSNLVTDALSENHYMTLQEEYGDADNDNTITEAVGKLDEERTEMADHSKTDDVDNDTELQDFEDKEGQQDIIFMQVRTENTQQNILPENFPEETVESPVNITQTETFSEEETVTDTVSQEEITDDLPIPEDPSTQSYPFVEPLAQTLNISGTLHEAAETEIKSSDYSCAEQTMDKLVDVPPQTEQLFKEEVVTETISQEEIADDLPIHEDPTTQSSPFVDPLALTQNILGTLHDSERIETKASEDSCIGETMENLVNTLPQPEPFLNDAVSESVSQEESGEFSALVEPFAQKTETQRILCASHEGAEFEIKPSIHNSLENTNEEDWQDLSMLTHVDATDNLSLSSDPASRPESQAQASSYTDDDHNNDNDDDGDESHSSEEESPNASQCPSPGAFAKPPKAHPALEEASENLSGVPFGFSESFTQQGPPNENEWEVLNASLKSQGTDNLKESESEYFNPFGNNDSLSRETYAKQTSEHEDIFQSDKTDEPTKSNGKDALHNFFSTNMEDDDFWGSSQQMAATFDPEEINQEQYQSVTFQTSQSLRFEEAWVHEKPIGSAEKTTLLSSVPSLGMEEEHSQIKTTQRREGEPVVATQSDDSVDEGDSWSSGEE